ncbi:MAG TPA: hypothetical protein VNT52_07855, partial [Acidimicrobiales bacterium]|nr:hypothetical protein [Acidimicrobiales bacterium]
MLPDKQGDDGRAPLGAAQFYDSSFATVRSLAVDASGTQRFVPDRTVVRGVNGWVAGVPPRDPPTSSSTSSTFYSQRNLGLTGSAAEGADAKTVALSPIAVAVDSKAQDLYVLEPSSIRHVNLREQVPTIRTVAGEALGSPLTVPRGSVIAADIFGHVFVGDVNSGAIHRLDMATAKLTKLVTMETGVGSLTVDAGGTALYAAGYNAPTVYRIDPVTGSKSVVAGGGAADQDGVSATSVRLKVETVAVDPFGGHLYISDGASRRIRKVDLSTGVINSVVGSGQRAYQPAGKAAAFAFEEPYAMAVDLSGSVFMLIPN